MTPTSRESSQESARDGAAAVREKVGVRPAAASSYASNRNTGLLSVMAVYRVIILPLVLVLLLTEAGRL